VNHCALQRLGSHRRAGGGTQGPRRPQRPGGKPASESASNSCQGLASLRPCRQSESRRDPSPSRGVRRAPGGRLGRGGELKSARRASGPCELRRVAASCGTAEPGAQAASVARGARRATAAHTRRAFAGGWWYGPGCSSCHSACTTRLFKLSSLSASGCWYSARKTRRA
jgi:hypothetical protein